MPRAGSTRPDAKREQYRTLAADLRALLGAERDFIANAANFATLLWHALPRLNWAGFYLLRRRELVLGPFQGRPACVRIPVGKGVCGAAARERRTIVVPDVRNFPRHIACDPRSRSEIVVPLMRRGRLIAVLDLDSPALRRFDDRDRRGLEALAQILVERSAPPVTASP